MVKDSIKEAGFGPKLNKVQADYAVKLIHKYYEDFGLGEHVLVKIDKNTFNICLKIGKPYPTILKKAPHQASPRNRIEIQIDELLALG